MKQVVTHIGKKGSQQIGGRAEDNKQGQNQHRKVHVQLAEDANPLVDAGQRRNGGNNGNDGDQNGLVATRYLDAGQVLQPGVDLLRPQSQRGRDAENRAEHGQQIGRMADGTIDTLTENRIETGTNRQRQSLAIGKIGQYQPHYRKQTPTMQPPVKDGDAHGNLSRLHRHLFTFGNQRVALKMIYRFGNAPEQNSYSDSGTEQHGKPGKITELRPFIILSQPNISITAENKPNSEKQCKTDQSDIIPGQLSGNEVLGRRVDSIGIFWIDYRK